jgi:tRNA G18 (ribose-2'-O)-methylase SpoU
MSQQLIVIAHNLRSAHNVGSLLRTADGLGISEVILTGYTPYPATQNDSRLPHLAAKINRQIQKTALDAKVNWRHAEDLTPVLKELRANGYVIAA